MKPRVGDILSIVAIKEGNVMRKFTRLFLLCSSIVAFAGGELLFADINWGSRESGIVLQRDAELNIGDDGLDVRGTLAFAGSLEAFQGGPLAFDLGVLENSGIRTLVSGSFSPSSELVLSGRHNVIFGELSARDIVLSDSDTVLELGIQNVFSGTITLNGGTLKLTNDTTLAKDAKIVGPGTVNKQNFNLFAHAGDDTSWLSALTFLNGTGLDGTGVRDAGSAITVAAGETLFLSNTTLTVKQNTFNLGAGAVLELGENVLLEFDSDVVLTSGTIKIVNNSDGSANVVRMRGINGRKLFALSPTDSNQTTLLDLNGNSVALQDLEFIGAGFIASNGSTASVALAGNAVLDVETSTDLNIDVEDAGNMLALTQDGLTLSGSFGFDGLAAENSLTVRFVLNNPITDKTVTMIDADGNIAYLPVKKGNPLVVFDGDTGVFLTNQNSLAGMIFEDQSITIANGLNTNTNGFVIDQNSYLVASDLEILGHPIKQNSARFVLKADRVTGAGIDQAFIRSSRAVKEPRLHRPVTAFAKFCAKRRAARPIAKPKVVVPAQVSKARMNAIIAKRKKASSKLPTRAFDMKGIEDFDGVFVRSLATPVSYQHTFVGTAVDSAGPEVGSALYKWAHIKNFETTSASAFNITLQDGAKIDQKSGTELFVDADHKMNFIGFGNQLEVKGNAAIDLSALGFDKNAGLTIQCTQVSAAKPTITLTGVLDLPAGSVLFLRGAGNVVMANGAAISLNGAVGNLALFSVGEGVELSIAANGLAYVGGNGAFEVSSDARLRVDNGARLHIADLPTVLTGDRVHNVDFSVDRGGEVFIAAGAAVETGAVRFIGNGEFSFKADGAQLVIGSAGTLAFNVNANDAPKRGWLRSFTALSSSMQLYGSIVFGPNVLDGQFVDLKTQVDLTELDIKGGGSVKALNQDPVRLTTSATATVITDQKFAATSKSALPAAILVTA